MKRLTSTNSIVFQFSYCRLFIEETDGFITQIRFAKNRKLTGFQENRSTVLSDAVRQLEEYFAGKRRRFDLPLRPEGTPFQKKVWNELTKIPYGQTVSYGQTAADIGNPKASRAVGSANHNNPVSIVIPCHRVIGATGKLTGYGGGLDMKKMLLELERSNS